MSDSPASGTSPGSPFLSVCIITGNEEDNIGRCLESVAFADEIVVVKDGMIDRQGSRDEVFPELIRSSEVTAACSRQ